VTVGKVRSFRKTSSTYRIEKYLRIEKIMSTLIHHLVGHSRLWSKVCRFGKESVNLLRPIHDIYFYEIMDLCNYFFLPLKHSFVLGVEIRVLPLSLSWKRNLREALLFVIPVMVRQLFLSRNSGL
jgi:hypothetical protein